MMHGQKTIKLKQYMSTRFSSLACVLHVSKQQTTKTYLYWVKVKLALTSYVNCDGDGMLVFHPYFGISRTAELSALRAGRTLPPRKFLGAPSCWRLRGTQIYRKVS
jgi:hypothetical protein